MRICGNHLLRNQREICKLLLRGRCEIINQHEELRVEEGEGTNRPSGE